MKSAIVSQSQVKLFVDIQCLDQAARSFGTALCRVQIQDQIEVPDGLRPDLGFYILKGQCAVCIDALDVRLPGYHYGSDIVQFQSLAPGFISGKGHMVCLELEGHRQPCKCARHNGIPFILRLLLHGYNGSKND